MATIFKALMTASLLLYAWAGWAGIRASDRAGLAAHESAGLVTALIAALAQSVPFAYFLGTGFWIRAFARASRAGPVWEARHREWMQGRAYKILYLSPFLTMATALVGMAAGAGHLPGWPHAALAAATLASAVAALVLVPPAMRRNAALMDELAERHQVPQPATPAYEQLIAEEEQVALPPLFQLSRVILFAAAQSVIVWCYLRFGTEGWRDTPFAPFGAAAVLLLPLGVALNDLHDPRQPAPPARAWRRALAFGGAGAAVFAGLLALA